MGSAMEAHELGLLAETLRKTMTATPSGAALGGALADLGWHEMLAEMPEVAVPLVFRLLGETGALAPVLNDVVEPGATPPMPYAGGTWVTWDRAGDAGTAMELPLRRVSEAGTLSAEALSAEALSAARRAVGWWLLGTGRAMLALARQHALDRMQFGEPVGSFQAVRHKLAETLVALDGAEAVLAAGEGELSSLLAKAAGGHAALLAAKHCQRVLGGIGFTAEHALHHYVKRALVLDGLLGSARTDPRGGTSCHRRRQRPAPC